jgi:serine/threonine-protein kinase
MPPPEVNQRPDEEQINRFADYIELCAEAPVGQCQEENVVVPINDQLQAMQTDLTQLDNNDRPFTRYLTLTHLHNAGYCGEEVDVFRFGMAKLVNSLSFEVTIRPPVPIDDLETIYRIDIRDYGWDEPINGLSDRWELIADQSPYSFERLESQADTLKLFSETDVPFMAADAFIEIASQPPLYYDLTNIPSTRGQLEARLGLNIDVNIEDEEVIRAGFLDSAVSRQNRIIERHELPFGAGQALWISYDFTDDGLQDQNIFASPLDFQETQAEILFSLPNGLHGYMLVDGNGNRIDEGNDQIVSDPGQPDLNVRSGISCFGCHEEIVVAEDQLRAHVLDGLEFDSQTKEVVEALYPDAVAFAEVQAADTERYLAALAQLGLTPDSSPTREPISDSFSRFSLSVDINRAAAELGISTDALFSNIGRLDPVLAPLNGASVKRDTWTAKFPNTVCLLNLGVADDPACDGVGGGDDGDDGGVEDDGGGETGAGETGGESGGVDCAVLDEAICGFFDECVFNEDAQLCEPA